MTYFCGLDIGSTYTKIVITSDSKIYGQEVFRTVTGLHEKIEQAKNAFCSKLGVTSENIKKTGATGYGRNNYHKADFKITEIKAVAKGVSYIDPDARVILDIGGQDFKIVYLRTDGTVSDFHISDKCASGTGRFIELLAMRLGLSLNELSKIDLSNAKDIGISSTCVVFADAEIIKLISENKKLPDIVYSIYLTIIRRILASLRGRERRIALTGGVAKNESFVSVIRKLLSEVSVYDASEVAGAYGVALLSQESDKNNFP